MEKRKINKSEWEGKFGNCISHQTFTQCLLISLELMCETFCLTWSGTSRTISSRMHVSQTKQLRYVLRLVVAECLTGKSCLKNCYAMNRCTANPIASQERKQDWQSDSQYINRAPPKRKKKRNKLIIDYDFYKKWHISRVISSRQCLRKHSKV